MKMWPTSSPQKKTTAVYTVDIVILWMLYRDVCTVDGGSKFLIEMTMILFLLLLLLLLLWLLLDHDFHNNLEIL